MKYSAEVTISLRSGILDVQGKTVEHALHSIGQSGIHNVHIGKYVTLVVEAESQEAAAAAVKEACEKLIANPIIEDYAITISAPEESVA